MAAECHEVLLHIAKTFLRFFAHAASLHAQQPYGNVFKKEKVECAKLAARLHPERLQMQGFIQKNTPTLRGM